MSLASTTARAPVCLITGVGDGTGAALARRFAAGGYRVAMLARNQERLRQMSAELPDSRAWSCDIGDFQALARVLDEVREHMGCPDVLVHNAVAASFRTFEEVDWPELEHNFRVNTTALYFLARALVTDMRRQGKGAILVTGNTSAWRGMPNYAAFAPTKAAQRILAQALARQLGPDGIHVAYVTIDAAIDTPWTRESINQGQAQQTFSLPADIADEVFHVAHQRRSTWSFDVELRPFVERW